MFITVEGGEGSGKSELMRRLDEWLGEKAHVITREPGGTAVGEKVREIFLRYEVCALAELLLVLASRVEHVRCVIEPALRRGDVVVCDRYVDSTVAYQAYGRGGDAEEVWKRCVEFVPLLPDVTLYLDVDPRVGLARVERGRGGRGDRLEFEREKFHESVREGFLHMARRCPERIVVLDASKSADDVAHDAVKVLGRFLCV